MPRKKRCFLLKKGRQRQYHTYTRYFLLSWGFKIKLFGLVKVGGI